MGKPSDAGVGKLVAARSARMLEAWHGDHQPELDDDDLCRTCRPRKALDLLDRTHRRPVARPFPRSRPRKISRGLACTRGARRRLDRCRLVPRPWPTRQRERTGARPRWCVVLHVFGFCGGHREGGRARFIRAASRARPPGFSGLPSTRRRVTTHVYERHQLVRGRDPWTWTPSWWGSWDWLRIDQKITLQRVIVRRPMTDDSPIPIPPALTWRLVNLIKNIAVHIACYPHRTKM
jgi:hypothetical protein